MPSTQIKCFSELSVSLNSKGIFTIGLIFKRKLRANTKQRNRCKLNGCGASGRDSYWPAFAARSLQQPGLKPPPMELPRPVFSVFILQIARVHFPTVTQASLALAEFGSDSAINIRSHPAYGSPFFIHGPWRQLLCLEYKVAVKDKYKMTSKRWGSLHLFSQKRATGAHKIANSCEHSRLVLFQEKKNTFQQ